MSELVLTRSAQAKRNVAENFVSVTYIAPKKKSKLKEDTDDNALSKKFDNERVNTESSNVDPRREQEKEMKRLRWEVMKFGSSGFQGAAKHKAKVALAIELGARPPKNHRQNYKNLKLQRSREKIRAAKQQEHQSGLAKSLKKQTSKNKRQKKDTGILDPYGKVQRGKTR